MSLRESASKTPCSCCSAMPRTCRFWRHQSKTMRTWSWAVQHRCSLLIRLLWHELTSQPLCTSRGCKTLYTHAWPWNDQSTIELCTSLLEDAKLNFAAFSASSEEQLDCLIECKNTYFCCVQTYCNHVFRIFWSKACPCLVHP